MEQWMIFFRKIHYLNFIHPVLYVPVFVSSSFCSLGGHTWEEIAGTKKFRFLQPPQ